MTVSKYLNTTLTNNVFEKGFILKIWRTDNLFPATYFISDKDSIRSDLLDKIITWIKIDLDYDYTLIIEIEIED